MEIIPAIDLRWGRCVRLYQGSFEKETVFSDDPLGIALRWQELGARRLHIVDLDGALEGKPMNLGVINGIAAIVDIPIQVGGGIRTMSIAQRVLGMGVARIVLGTSAVEKPNLVKRLCKRFGSEAVVVSLDARDGKVAVKGWKESTSVQALELAREMALLGIKRLVYTDISRDGTLTEPNFAAIEEMVKGTGLAILASGGISSSEHIRRLAAIGVEGAIIGSALYRGTLALPDALIALEDSTPG